MHHIKPQILKQDERQRVGRGFSREELKKAGLNLQEARRIELPIDFRRRTAHDENVEAVKTYAAQEKAKAKPVAKPATKKTDAKAEKEKSKR
jgi:large subunit ribosomal protein L13e